MPTPNAWAQELTRATAGQWKQTWEIHKDVDAE